MRSAGCEGGSARLTPAERARCAERLGAGRERSVDPLPREKRLAWEPKPQRAGWEDPESASCVGGGICMPDVARVKIPFGQPPKALPVIPPSTLRGDDDALRPKPRP